MSPAAPRPVLDLGTVIKAYDVRGLVGTQLDQDVVRAIGAAAATVLGVADGGSMVIGHDMRASSPELVMAFAAGVTAAGGDVTVIGLCSTDGLYYASGAMGVPGAMFTASHNPAAYNGIKLCRAGARPVGEDSGLAQVRELAQSYLDGVAPLPAAEQPGTLTRSDVLADYAAHLRSLVDLSDGRPLTVVVDAGNGMGGLTTPAVLGEAAGLPALPLDVLQLFFELDGTFPNHEANPLDPANLVDLQRAVVEHGADLGLAFDGDADRCFVVDERGEAVSPSAITALVALREIARAKEPRAADPGSGAASRPVVLHNLITSRAVPELVEAAGATAVRTRVGHSFIKGEMARTGAVFGGEHSAHYYFADFWGADTGMLAAMHVLAALGESAAALSTLTAEYDPYAASGEINSTVADAAAVTARIRAQHEDAGAGTDTFDGLTVSSPDGVSPWWWFNLRPSNTEPLLRLNVEGQDPATMERVRDEVLAAVRA